MSDKNNELEKIDTRSFENQNHVILNKEKCNDITNKSECEDMDSKKNESVLHEKENGLKNPDSPSDSNLPVNIDSSNQEKDTSDNDKSRKSSTDPGNSENVNGELESNGKSFLSSEKNESNDPLVTKLQSSDEEKVDGQNKINDESNEEANSPNVEIRNATSENHIKSSEYSSIDHEKSQDTVHIDKKSDEKGKVKIKLRSFASLCDDDSPKSAEDESLEINESNIEVDGVAVGDIVQHSNFVESDESGVMHLKISNVVGGEDCITGLSFDNEPGSPQLQISSISSLVENFSSENAKLVGINSENDIDNDQAVNDSGESKEQILDGMEDSNLSADTKDGTVVNIYKSPIVNKHSCLMCKKRIICEFRVVFRRKQKNEIYFVCTVKCKSEFVEKLPSNDVVQKPRLYFERICGMCGTEINVTSADSTVITWQTREFCNKLCLADHIGEVARTCFFCRSSVRLIYMVKYCVRFGSDIHQFCCNTCLEMYKATIKVCSFCQKNLRLVSKVVSPSGKEYCSKKCLKRAQRRDIGQANYMEKFQCTVCLKVVVNEFEFMNNSTCSHLCSSPCLNVFKYVNKVKSVNCCLCSRLMNAEETSNYFFIGRQLRVFCTESCFSVFVISARKIVTCYYCKVKKYNSDMIWSRYGNIDSEYYFCSYCCLNLFDGPMKVDESEKNEQLEEKSSFEAIDDFCSPTKDSSATDTVSANTLTSATDSNTAVSESQSPNAKIPIPMVKNCSMCNKLESTQFHMVMSDSTLKSFCSYTCATKYKSTFGFLVSDVGSKNEVVMFSDKPAEEEVQQPVPECAPTTLTDQLKKTTEYLETLISPLMVNKSSSCMPIVQEKGVQCGSSFSDTEINKVLLPVPVPIFVPTPMMMYNAPVPFPLVIPVPVPIPVLIPTGEKTTEDIQMKIQKIREEYMGKVGKSNKRKLAEDEDEEKEGNEKAGISLLCTLQNDLIKFNLSNKDDSSVDSQSSNSEPLSKRQKVDQTDSNVVDHTRCLAAWISWYEEIKKSKEYLAEITKDKDLATLSSKTLSKILIEFLEDLNKYFLHIDVDTVFYLLLGLQKYLFENGSPYCLFLETNFDLLTSVFNKSIEKFFCLVSHSSTKKLNETRITEEMLWDARQLGAHTPHVLLNTLFYFNTKNFHITDAVDHFNLSVNQMKKVTDTESGAICLTCSIPGKKDSLHMMTENKSNPLRCPVKLYEFYLSKCPAEIQEKKESYYYVYPERTCQPDSPVWYSLDFLELRAIDKMLNRFLLVKEIQDTLHSSTL